MAAEDSQSLFQPFRFGRVMRVEHAASLLLINSQSSGQLNARDTTLSTPGKRIRLGDGLRHVAKRDGLAPLS
jgi:hypothetical protein